VGDVNGDGHLDLVFACRDAGSDGERSWIYWSGPDGFSEARRTSLAGHRACDVVVGDLDGDGCAEIILCQNHTAESFTSSSRVFRGTQTGVVNEPIELVTEDARRVFLLRGPDDPHPQVAFINYFSRDIRGNIPAYVYFNGPDGFSADRRRELKAFGSVESLGCDFNDDGRPDLVLANAAENAVSCDPGSFVYISTSDGLPTEDTWILPTVRAHGVCCADLNRDGYLDLIFCGFDNPELVIFYGSAKGFDIEHPVRIRLEHEGTVYKEPRWIYLADLNNDGWLDLVVPEITAERSFILWGGPEGFSMDRCQALSATRAACARAADLIGNGYLDLILGGHTPSVGAPHDSFVYIYWNGPDGLREDRRTLLPSAGVNAISVADFNRDGLLDMFVCSYHDGKNRDIDSYIYWNRPGLGFRAADRTRMFTHSASGSLAVDFNEDGWPDLAVAYHKVDGDHVGYSVVWQNGP